ncbi:hypothetical protein D3C78_1020600 [compost metagenome]
MIAMDSILQISIGVITIALLVTLYFVIRALVSLTKTIEETKYAVGQLRTEMTSISADVKEAVHNTNVMTMDVRSKLHSLDVLFASVNDIGHAIQSFTGAARESAASIVATLKSDERKEPGVAGAVCDGILSGIRLWQKVKSR